MSKEYAIECYEKAVEDIMEELDVEGNEAEEVLNQRIDKNTEYLDGYIT